MSLPSPYIPKKRLPNLRDHYGRYTLFYAIKRGYTSLAKLLLDCGAHPEDSSHFPRREDSPDTYGRTTSEPILTINGNKLERGEASHQFERGRLSYQVIENDSHLAKRRQWLDRLYRREYDIFGEIFPNRTFPPCERSSIHLAVATDQAELVHMLLRAGADPTSRDISCITVLQTAIGRTNLEVISLLLDWKDMHDRTLIMFELLVFRDITDSPLPGKRDTPLWVVRQVILRTKYNSNVQYEYGHTALSYAVMENIPEIVDLLLDYGRSEPNIQNLRGETPLMRAASAGFSRILRRLLTFPLTDIAIKDKRGFTALDHASRAGNKTAVVLLKRKHENLLTQHLSQLVANVWRRRRVWPFQTSAFAGLIRMPWKWPLWRWAREDKRVGT